MTVLLVVFGTILLYLGMTYVYRRFTYPLFLPIITTTTITVILLSTLDISYETYMSGAKWIDGMLGPAVVSMAYPLYIHREKLLKHLPTLVMSVFVALLSGMISITILSKLFSFDQEILLSFLPKSITSPVAMPISESIGGLPTLTAVFVILAGLIGALFGPILFRFGGIESAISRGISMGSASHGIGLTKLTEYGEETLTMGTVGMTLSAIFGAFVSPLFALLI